MYKNSNRTKLNQLWHRVKSPRELSRKSWRRAAIDTVKQVLDKDIMLFSSAIAFNSTFAFFPLVAACVLIAGGFVSAHDIHQITDQIEQVVPSDVASLLSTQLETALDNKATNWIAVMFSLAIALVSISGAATRLIKSLNVMYERKETRSAVQMRTLGITVTCGLIVALLVGVPAVFFGEPILRSLGVAAIAVQIYSFAKWLVLGLVVMLALSALYQIAPDRRLVKPQWVTTGAAIATLLWVIVTVLFFIYVQYFGNYSSSYSLFAGIIVLMVWLNLSTVVILLGAIINHQLEKRAGRQIIC